MLPNQGVFMSASVKLHLCRELFQSFGRFSRCVSLEKVNCFEFYLCNLDSWSLTAGPIFHSTQILPCCIYNRLFLLGYCTKCTKYTLGNLSLKTYVMFKLAELFLFFFCNKKICLGPAFDSQNWGLTFLVLYSSACAYISVLVFSYPFCSAVLQHCTVASSRTLS